MLMTKPHDRGFTLIELMIVVAVVAILAAVAYPSYQSSVQRSWRANAAACLSELAQGMERHFTSDSTYDGTGTDPFESGCAVEGGMSSRYAFSFQDPPPDGTSFTLQAVPQGAGPQATDTCGTLTINQAAEKTASGGTVSECWRR